MFFVKHRAAGTLAALLIAALGALALGAEPAGGDTAGQPFARTAALELPPATRLLADAGTGRATP